MSAKLVIPKNVADFFRQAGIEVSEAQPGTPAAKPAIEQCLERIEALLIEISLAARDSVRATERQHDTLGRSARRQARMAGSPYRGEAR